METDDAKFVVRADKIKSETKQKHRLRMCRFLGRTLPMFALAAAWPAALVLVLLPALPYAQGQVKRSFNRSGASACSVGRAEDNCWPHFLWPIEPFARAPFPALAFHP